MICPVFFSKFSDILPAFTYTSVIGNLWSISLEVSILISSLWKVLYLASDIIVEYYQIIRQLCFIYFKAFQYFVSHFFALLI